MMLDSGKEGGRGAGLRSSEGPGLLLLCAAAGPITVEEEPNPFRPCRRRRAGP